jgi:hypothetical protein
MHIAGAISQRRCIRIHRVACPEPMTTMRTADASRRAMISTFVLALVLVAGWVPTAAASPCAHTTSYNRGSRVLVPVRARSILRPAVEVRTARPAGAKHRPDRRGENGARSAQDPAASFPVVFERFQKERSQLHRPLHAGVANDPAGRTRPRDATSSLTFARYVRQPAGEAVFHDANAPPFVVVR